MTGAVSPFTSLITQSAKNILFLHTFHFVLSKPASDYKTSDKITAGFRGESINMQVWNLEELGDLTYPQIFG